VTGRLLVTGTGRSGTTYLTELLRACGVRCGHEAVFGPYGQGDWDDFEADASFMAVPYLPLDIPTVLVLRHPLAVVKSFHDFGFFTQCTTEYQHFVAHYAPMAWWGERSELDTALAYWCTWNLRAALHADRIYRLEHLNPSSLAEILELGGFHPGPATNAFAVVPPGLNPKTAEKWRDWSPNWADFNPNVAATARQLAEMWGYG
jgi:hypothetical protein